SRSRRRARLVRNQFHRCSLLSARLTSPHKNAITATLSSAFPSAFYRLASRRGGSRLQPWPLLEQGFLGGAMTANTFRDRWRITLIVVHRYSFHAIRPSHDGQRFISCYP